MPNEDRAAYVRRRWGGGLAKTLPKGGKSDENLAACFAEVTLDVVEENSFQQRRAEEIGPRHVHLRTNALGEISHPPHIVENRAGEYYCQAWTGSAKVDRNLFILDRTFESTERQLRSLVTMRDVPVLTAQLGKQPVGKQTNICGIGRSFRARILNAPKRPPIPTSSPLDLPWLE